MTTLKILMSQTGMPPLAPLVPVEPASSPFVPSSRRVIDFSTEGLKRNVLDGVQRLYDKFPLQCDFCGLRFPDKEFMAKHLDWHFKMNRRRQDRQKHVCLESWRVLIKSYQGASQIWFLDVDEWISKVADIHDDYQDKIQQMLLQSQDKKTENEEEPEDDTDGVAAEESQKECPVGHFPNDVLLNLVDLW